MTSPKIEVFFLYDNTGAPLTGATPTFDTYKDDLGSNLTQPSISEIGGGAYKFTPDITTNPNRGIAYVVDGGVSSNPRRLARYVRPEDYAVDKLIDLYDLAFGKQQVFTSGGDANRLVTYRTDGITILKKFDLFDSGGSPASVNFYRRDPV